ncbi:MAG: aldehyde dehydrogenase family protein [Fimbriimonadaceae bacterium]|nr:aldehyde dehydrogenase family protein [Fimbriimonadaceae bacterium]QYK55090.1 MAG: aldehyde dehydrogenase family protein [Fimbriimonadaceae bacterium]
MRHQELLIGGQFFGGVCDQGTPKNPVRAPYDGRIIGSVAEGGASEMDAALHAAEKAFTSWRRTPIYVRVNLLHRIAELSRERAKELTEVLTLEVGKPIKWSEAEVARLSHTFDLAAQHLTSPKGHVLPVDYDERGVGHRAIAERVPRGVVLAITPYNWPFNLAAHKIAPALAAGCTIVWKPAEAAAQSSLLLARLIHEAGCPDGVLNAVNVPSAVASKAVTDPRVKVVSFTGSEAVGWSIKEKAYDKQVLLELGGDAFAVLCQDADWSYAVKRLVPAAYGYAGQICISVQHCLVHESRYGDVRDALVERTRACKWGDPEDPEVVCGPVINEQAADRIEAWLQEAVQGGAKILAGGRRHGLVIEPTLVEGVPPGSRLDSDEVFGPVLTLAPFTSDEEAIARVNRSRFGIQTGVFTNDYHVAEQFFQELEVGGVVVNDCPNLRFDAVPYGGVKRSGFGREGTAVAFDELTEPRSLVFCPRQG